MINWFIQKNVFDALEYSILLKLAKIYDIDDSGQSLTLHKILNKNNKKRLVIFQTNR